VVNQTLDFQIRFCGKSPDLRVAAKRCAPYKKNEINPQKMKTTHLKFISIFLICLNILVSCQKDTQKSYVVPKFDSNQYEFSNDELFNATYSIYKIPDNFYHENLGDTSLYYVNTVSIDSLEKKKWIELSTNSAETAKEWSIKSSPINSVLTPVIENEKYFESFRTYNPSDHQLIKFRTHKESYFTRGSYDFLNKTDTIGVFNKQNFRGANAKELIDYLWYTHNYDNNSMKVLSSFFEDSSLKTVVYHYELFIVFGDRGIYDQIKLLKSVYSLEKETGITTVNVIEIKTIIGNLN